MSHTTATAAWKVRQHFADDCHATAFRKQYHEVVKLRDVRCQMSNVKCHLLNVTRQVLQAWACCFAHYWWDRFPLPTFIGEYLYDSANLGVGPTHFARQAEGLKGTYAAVISGLECGGSSLG